MKDVILQKFFELDRWVYAIDKGVGKDIDKSHLYQLTKPEVRAELYKAIRDNRYEISPPQTAQIPKDNGEFRTVYINEPIDRVLLSIANDLLFELTPDMVHKKCLSYQKGIGCGAIVQGVSKKICETQGDTIGWKSDLSKYFDSVPIEYIDRAFDAVEARYGHSAVIDMLRKYYHCDFYFDLDRTLQQKYQSLKQGCSVASWLADVILFHIDEQLAQMNGEYIRYSDDMLFVGKDYEKAMAFLVASLEEMNMKLNPKKVEYLSSVRWFKFLGYSIKGPMISLSATRIKKFQHEIERLTIKNPQTTLKKAINAVNRFLYHGNGKHSWATQILPICNVKKDINELNKFVMDCLKAVASGKKKIGGLGYVVNKSDGCIQRGIGRHVRTNRVKLEKIEGYMSIGCMQNAMVTSREAYRALVSTL